MLAAPNEIELQCVAASWRRGFCAPGPCKGRKPYRAPPFFFMEIPCSCGLCAGSINPDADEDEGEEDEEAPDGAERTAAELAGDTNSNAMAEEDKEDMEVRKSASLSFCSALDR